MDKKICLAALSTCILASNVANYIVSAEEVNNNENMLLESYIEADNEVIRKSNTVSISYVDRNGEPVAKADNKSTSGTVSEWLMSVPLEIDGLYPVGVRINGKEIGYANIVKYGLSTSKPMDDITIEWVYSDEWYSQLGSQSYAIYHKSFFDAVGDGDSLGKTDYVFTPEASHNVHLTKEIFDYLKSSLNKDSNLSIIESYSGDKWLMFEDWFTDSLNLNKYVDHRIYNVSESDSIGGTVIRKEYSAESEPKYKKMYVYSVDTENKKFSKAGTLDFVKSEKDDSMGYEHTYRGNVKECIGRMLVYTYEDLGVEGLTDKGDNDVNINKDDVVDDNKTEDTKNESSNELESATTFRNEYDNYRVSYDYLKSILNKEYFAIYKGQDFVPQFLLKSSNIKELLDKKDKSFVLSVDINGNSLNESPKVLTGLSKDFYENNTKKIYRWVHYKSNIGESNFKHENTITFPLAKGDFKDGDMVYLYSTSNLKNGEITLVGENKITNSNSQRSTSYDTVSFDTKLDISDRAFFLTTAKIDTKLESDSNDSKVEGDKEVDSNKEDEKPSKNETEGKDELPTTGGVSNMVLAGGVAMAVGGALMLFKKKRK